MGATQKECTGRSSGYQTLAHPGNVRGNAAWLTMVVIAVAGTNHDANWTKQLGDDVETVIMQQNNRTEPHYYTRRGNEAGAYLTFMIDYYNCLPEVHFIATSLHGGKASMRNSRITLVLIVHLQHLLSEYLILLSARMMRQFWHCR